MPFCATFYDPYSTKDYFSAVARDKTRSFKVTQADLICAIEKVEENIIDLKSKADLVRIGKRELELLMVDSASIKNKEISQLREELEHLRSNCESSLSIITEKLKSTLREMDFIEGRVDVKFFNEREQYMQAFKDALGSSCIKNN